MFGGFFQELFGRGWQCGYGRNSSHGLPCDRGVIRMKCENPFFSCEGKGNRIVLDIIFNGKRLSICEDCWEKIANSKIEWGELVKEER